jgi:hypothetical protein
MSVCFRPSVHPPVLTVLRCTAQMTTGIAWDEGYDPTNPSDTTRMLFGSADFANYTAALPQASPAGPINGCQ